MNGNQNLAIKLYFKDQMTFVRWTGNEIKELTVFKCIIFYFSIFNIATVKMHIYIT